MIIVKVTNANPNNITKFPDSIEWKYITEPFIKTNADIAVTNGHGLGSTRWKKCL
jgi:hypothetical protein